MRSFLVNKNLCLYYWLKKRIGKKIAFEVANKSEKVILIFGRERIPHRRFRIHKEVKQLELISLLSKSSFEKEEALE
jgi:hypothetical protein